MFKMGYKYYATLKERLTDNSVQLYCSRKTRPEKCKFRIKLKMISVFDPAMPGFYDIQNFEIQSSKLSGTHSCRGYDTSQEANRSTANRSWELNATNTTSDFFL